MHRVGTYHTPSSAKKIADLSEMQKFINVQTNVDIIAKMMVKYGPQNVTLMAQIIANNQTSSLQDTEIKKGIEMLEACVDDVRQKIDIVASESSTTAILIYLLDGASNKIFLEAENIKAIQVIQEEGLIDQGYRPLFTQKNPRQQQSAKKKKGPTQLKKARRDKASIEQSVLERRPNPKNTSTYSTANQQQGQHTREGILTRHTTQSISTRRTGQDNPTTDKARVAQTRSRRTISDEGMMQRERDKSTNWRAALKINYKTERCITNAELLYDEKGRASIPNPLPVTTAAALDNIKSIIQQAEARLGHNFFQSIYPPIRTGRMAERNLEGRMQFLMANGALSLMQRQHLARNFIAIEHILIRISQTPLFPTQSRLEYVRRQSKLQLTSITPEATKNMDYKNTSYRLQAMRQKNATAIKEVAFGPTATLPTLEEMQTRKNYESQLETVLPQLKEHRDNIKKHSRLNALADIFAKKTEHTAKWQKEIQKEALIIAASHKATMKKLKLDEKSNLISMLSQLSAMSLVQQSNPNLTTAETIAAIGINAKYTQAEVDEFVQKTIALAEINTKMALIMAKQQQDREAHTAAGEMHKQLIKIKAAENHKFHFSFVADYALYGPNVSDIAAPIAWAIPNAEAAIIAGANLAEQFGIVGNIGIFGAGLFAITAAGINLSELDGYQSIVGTIKIINKTQAVYKKIKDGIVTVAQKDKAKINLGTTQDAATPSSAASNSGAGVATNSVTKFGTINGNTQSTSAAEATPSRKISLGSKEDVATPSSAASNSGAGVATNSVTKFGTINGNTQSTSAAEATPSRKISLGSTNDAPTTTGSDDNPIPPGTFSVSTNSATENSSDGTSSVTLGQRLYVALMHGDQATVSSILQNKTSMEKLSLFIDVIQDPSKYEKHTNIPLSSFYANLEKAFEGFGSLDSKVGSAMRFTSGMIKAILFFAQRAIESKERRNKALQRETILATINDLRDQSNKNRKRTENLLSRARAIESRHETLEPTMPKHEVAVNRTICQAINRSLQSFLLKHPQEYILATSTLSGTILKESDGHYSLWDQDKLGKFASVAHQYEHTNNIKEIFGITNGRGNGSLKACFSAVRNKISPKKKTENPAEEISLTRLYSSFTPDEVVIAEAKNLLQHKANEMEIMQQMAICLRATTTIESIMPAIESAEAEITLQVANGEDCLETNGCLNALYNKLRKCDMEIECATNHSITHEPSLVYVALQQMKEQYKHHSAECRRLKFKLNKMGFAVIVANDKSNVVAKVAEITTKKDGQIQLKSLSYPLTKPNEMAEYGQTYEPYRITIKKVGAKPLANAHHWGTARHKEVRIIQQINKQSGMMAM